MQLFAMAFRTLLSRYARPYSFHTTLTNMPSKFGSMLFQCRQVKPQGKYAIIPASTPNKMYSDPVLNLLDSLGCDPRKSGIDITKVSPNTAKVTSFGFVPTHFMLMIRDIFNEHGNHTMTNATGSPPELSAPNPFDAPVDTYKFDNIVEKWNACTDQEELLNVFHSLYTRDLSFSVDDPRWSSHKNMNMTTDIYNKAVQFIHFSKYRHSLPGGVAPLYFDAGLKVNNICPAGSFLRNHTDHKDKQKYYSLTITGDIYGTQTLTPRKHVPFWMMINLRHALHSFGIKTSTKCEENWY
jgi:hypothetical protein